MKSISTAIIEDAINKLDPTFDTHDVAEYLIKYYPKEFGSALVEYSTGKYALLELTKQLGSKIDRTFGRKTIRKTRKVKSRNMAGQDNQNQEWERICSSPVIPLP